jgi:hypothetical protein
MRPSWRSSEARFSSATAARPLFERALQLAYPLRGLPADGLELGRVALLLLPVARP